MRLPPAALLLSLGLLSSCVPSAIDVSGLETEGYRKIIIRGLENQQENTNYALWVKSIDSAQRQLRICVVPNVPVDQYHWTVTVLVDGVETWRHDNLVYGYAHVRRPIDCVTSRPLPKGQLLYRSSFQYTPPSGEDRPAAPTPTPPPPTPPAAQPQPLPTPAPPVSLTPPAVPLTPTWEKGFEWRYRWTSPRGSGTFFRTVVRKETLADGEYYVIRSAEREIYYTVKDLAWLMERLGGDLEIRSTPAEARFVWPLAVGNQWETKVHLERPLQRTTEERSRVIRVETWEAVTVPAGTFGSFHIVVKDPTGAVTSEQWYAPEVRWLVQERIQLTYGVEERQLMRYSLSPLR